MQENHNQPTDIDNSPTENMTLSLSNKSENELKSEGGTERAKQTNKQQYRHRTASLLHKVHLKDTENY